MSAHEGVDGLSTCTMMRCWHEAGMWERQVGTGVGGARACSATGGGGAQARLYSRPVILQTDCNRPPCCARACLLQGGREVKE